MASITLYPTSNGNVAHNVSGGGTAYGALADNNDSTYIYHKATKDQEVVTSTFNVGTSSSISGRYVINSIVAVSRTKKGYNLMNTASAHSNLYVGGIEGASWGLSVSTSWTNRSHTTDMSKYTNINGKAITSLPSLVLHLQSTTEVAATGDNKYVGFSRAYVTLDYDLLYTQSAQGSTGVSISLSNTGSAVDGYYRNGTTTTYTATLSNGYGFDGWYTASTGGSNVSTAVTYSETCNSNRTLYARTFTVEATGSEGVTTSLSRDSNCRTFTFTATLNSNTKYGFKGWYNNSSGTGTPVSTNVSYTTTLSSATHLYAITYQVSVVVETGISASLTRASNGRDFTFKATLDSNTSYGFKGWYDNTNGTGSTLSTSLAYTETVSDNRTLYAKVFNVSAVGSTGVSTSLTRDSNGRKFTFNASVSSGYGFKGWCTNSAGTGTPVSTSVAYSETLSNDRTLYAFAYTMSVTGSTGVSASVTRGSDARTFTATATLSNNYAFDGWYNGSTRISRNLTYSEEISTDTVWTAKAYTVAYTGDTGITVSANRSSDGLSYTFTGSFKNDSTTSVHTLNKWTVNTQAQSTTALTQTVAISGNTTVSAFTYTTNVSTSGYGGVSVSIARNTNKSTTITATMEHGWDFDGWFIGNTKQYTSTTQTINNISASNTYVAKTTHHIYSITVTGDEYCTTTYSTPDYYYGTTVSFSAYITDNDYKFVGWYLDSAHEQLYSTQQNIQITINDDIVLYAVSIRKNIMFIKKDSTYVYVVATYIKINGSWVILDETEYLQLLQDGKLFIKT